MKQPQDLPIGSVPQWTLGDRLRKARTWVGLSTEDLAAELDVTARTVTNYETGQTRPRRPTLALWALKTGVPFEWLDGGEGDSARTVSDTGGYPSTFRAAA